MKLAKLFILLLIIAFSASSIFSQAKPSKAKPKTKPAVAEEVMPAPPPQVPVKRAEDGAIVHLTTGISNPERVLHALTFALELTANYKVLVFLDMKGPEAVVNKLPSLELKKYEPSKLLVSKLLDKGVQIVVYQQSLEALNYTQFDLVKGVKYSKSQDFFDFTDGRIITFEY